MLINPQKLAEAIVEYSLTKQFEPTTWDTVPIRLKCIDKEISEYTDALRAWDGDRGALAVVPARRELADVAIYALLIMAHMGNESWYFRTGLQERITMFAAPETIVLPMRRYADQAFELWRRGEDRKKHMIEALELLVVVCAVMSGKFFGASLDMLVTSKLHFMSERPAKHGKDGRS